MAPKQALLAPETTERKEVSVPLDTLSEEVTTITLTFTKQEWEDIREAVSNEASSWRVTRKNKGQTEFYGKVDDKRGKKGYGPRQREYVGNYIFTGGKAKKYRHTRGPLAVFKKFARLELIAKKIREASKLA